MPNVASEALVSRNPATGAELGRVPVTPVSDVAGIVQRARQAQAIWAATGWGKRQAVLKRWWRALAQDAEAWADLIRAEIGKPRGEAMAGDLIASLDGIRWTVRHGRKALADQTIGPGHQRLLQLPSARVSYRPVGVVGLIGTWNYPLFLNAPVIAQALAAGNAVVWKPSELAVLTGWKLQQSLLDAGFPDGLVSAVFGGPEIGQALTAAAIDKGVFTGGIDNGRRVLTSLAERGISAVAELSGFDPAIVLPDAPLASTSRSLTWSAFVGAGQTCVSVKRIYVVGDPTPWVEALSRQARSLRIGDPAGSEVDLGPLISESARDRFQATLRAAVAAGAQVCAGGSALTGPGWFFQPTVLHATTSSPEEALAGVFGPVVVVRGVTDVEAAIEAANASPYALAASVWSADRRKAARVASRLDAGMVTINQAVTPTMHAAAPFGGVKASGYGRTHGPAGLREFVQTQALFSHRAGGFHPELFPYGASSIETVLRIYRRLFHG